MKDTWKISENGQLDGSVVVDGPARQRRHRFMLRPKAHFKLQQSLLFTPTKSSNSTHNKQSIKSFNVRVAL